MHNTIGMRACKRKRSFTEYISQFRPFDPRCARVSRGGGSEPRLMHASGKLERVATVFALVLKSGPLPDEVNPQTAGIICRSLRLEVTMGMVALGATLNLSVQFSSPSLTPKNSVIFWVAPFGQSDRTYTDPIVPTRFQKGFSSSSSTP